MDRRHPTSARSAPTSAAEESYLASERSADRGVFVVIPTFNEALDELRKVIRSLHRYGYSVVVVDDGSSTPLSSDQLPSPVHLCTHLLNLGQGAAIQTGLDYAFAQGADVIVTFDADGQHRAEDIATIIAPIRNGAVDVCLGSRFGVGARAENIPLIKLVLLRIAVLATRLMTGLKLTDTHNGLRAFSRNAAATINLTQNRMSHASQILQRISERRFRYCEVPVVIHYTDYSIRKGQRVSNLFNIIWESLMEIFRR